MDLGFMEQQSPALWQGSCRLPPKARWAEVSPTLVKLSLKPPWPDIALQAFERCTNTALSRPLGAAILQLETLLARPDNWCFLVHHPERAVIKEPGFPE